MLAWAHGLARAMLAVSVRVLLGFQRHRARRYGIRAGRWLCAWDELQEACRPA
jgi:hypothetical protein